LPSSRKYRHEHERNAIKVFIIDPLEYSDGSHIPRSTWRQVFQDSPAKEMLKSFTPDLVVIDFALPGIGGPRAYADFVRCASRSLVA